MKKDETLVKLHNNNYYILASSSYADDLVHTLNFGDTFAVFDRWGDINPIGKGLQGIYHRGTRFVNNLQLEINNYRPLLLSSAVKYENELLSVDLTNPAMEDLDGQPMEQNTVHIARTKFLRNGVFHESIRLHNYGFKKYRLQLSLSFTGDFKDIFEIRGIKRKNNGEQYPVSILTDKSLKLAYRGLDDIKRETIFKFDPEPMQLRPQQAEFTVILPPGETLEIRLTAIFQTEEHSIQPSSFTEAFKSLEPSLQKSQEIIAHIHTSNEQFNHWINRSKNDLLSLLTQTREGKYPYAGVPWYNTIFGRDGIITALETLWIAPDIAKGVLALLAKKQAADWNAVQDAEPGKILHEMRYGEMAATGEVPFKEYYGSIDATPLFIVLAGKYLQRTNDRKFIEKIWNNILVALNWIDKYGDIDGDGWIEYKRKMEGGLANQGWKDSHDAVSHKNGRLAEPPIALCEVQGYVYDAKIQAAYMARILKQEKLSLQLESEASGLKKRFNDVFWNESLGTYALALDGNKRPCLVVSSNAGHCLYSGIADPEKAYRTGELLMSDKMYSGWGIRTLAADESRFNPMSYHNGSVWPHDNAIIAAGMARYGMINHTLQVMQGLFEASLFIELQRLPELFCGFESRKGEAPTAYPVACSPQAWSVGAVFLLLQACLQMTIDAVEKKIIFQNPVLPAYLKELQIRNLAIGKEVIELEIIRYEHDLGIHVTRKPADWQVVAIK